jgi:hypothetical protein
MPFVASKADASALTPAAGGRQSRIHQEAVGQAPIIVEHEMAGTRPAVTSQKPRYRAGI